MWGAYPLAFISYLIKYTSHNNVKLLDCHLSCFIETFLKIILYLFASLDLMLERLHEEEHDAKIQMSKKNEIQMSHHQTKLFFAYLRA